MISNPPNRYPFQTKDGKGNVKIAPVWAEWFMAVFRICFSLTESGTTANRPTKYLWVGRRYFDTTLGKPIWHDGTNWVDATGATV